MRGMTTLIPYSSIANTAGIQTAKLSSLSLPFPVNLPHLFGRSTQDTRPVILEIGFGTAGFLVHLGKTNPHADVIGIEISNQCLVKGETAIRHHRLPNVRVIHSRAETALHHLFSPRTFSAIYINFPDPWFKKGHSHRRLMQRDTLDLITNRLTDDGRLFLATDILPYAEMSHALFAETPSLVNQLPAAWTNDPHEVPNRIVTKYEGRAREQGRDCYYFAYQRSTQPAPDFPVIEDFRMPHIVFTSPLELDAIRAHFAPFRVSEGDTHVGFMEVYRGRNGLLFEIHASEPSIEQHTTLMLAPHDRTPNEYTLHLYNIGHPRPTRGLHLAVRGLSDWIMALDPQQSTVVKHKLVE
jgi:tRNA (guanine-N7-)-methyltransferase